jgi:hypothetical protein
LLTLSNIQQSTAIIDLRDQADRKKYELHNKMEINQKFHKFASSHSEVLLVGRVPPECLTLIPFTGTVPDSDESSDSDLFQLCLSDHIYIDNAFVFSSRGNVGRHTRTSRLIYTVIVHHRYLYCSTEIT